jgi:hypothetical protein
MAVDLMVAPAPPPPPDHPGECSLARMVNPIWTCEREH